MDESQIRQINFILETILKDEYLNMYLRWKMQKEGIFKEDIKVIQRKLGGILFALDMDKNRDIFEIPLIQDIRIYKKK